MSCLLHMEYRYKKTNISGETRHFKYPTLLYCCVYKNEPLSEKHEIQLSCSKSSLFHRHKYAHMEHLEVTHTCLGYPKLSATSERV